MLLGDSHGRFRTMAYSPLMAAALSGATVRQLGHWRRTSLIEAEYRTPTRVFYSYRDIVALRTFVYLRESLSLQKIRRAVGTLRNLGESEHLSQYRLVAHGSTVVLRKDDEDVDLVHVPGQTFLIRLSDMARPFETQVGTYVRDLEQPTEYVSVDPQIRGGHPVISGTRVPFDAVSSLVQDGVPAEQISLYYPGVTAEAARSAVEFSQYVSGFEALAA
jgi:uncharacterized protein (DUF433 family)